MRSGQLIHRVEFQRPTGTLDDAGHVATWETLTGLESVPANVRGVSAREMLRGGAMEATFTHTVAVRYHPTISRTPDVAGWRMVWDGRRLNIRGVKDLEEKRQWLIFDCTEGSADGQ